MPQRPQKVVQAYIQLLQEVIKRLESANSLALWGKGKFELLAPDLTETNITQAQIDTLNTWLSNLNSITTAAVATVIKNKDVPSHGRTALE